MQISILIHHRNNLIDEIRRIFILHNITAFYIHKHISFSMSAEVSSAFFFYDLFNEDIYRLALKASFEGGLIYTADADELVASISLNLLGELAGQLVSDGTLTS